MTYSTPGIFNVLDPWYAGAGMVANDTTPATAEANAQVLQQIIFYAINAGLSGCAAGVEQAATILFPGNNVVPPTAGGKGSVYSIAVPSGSATLAAALINCNWPLRLLGTGNVKLHMVANGDGQWGDMFLVHSNVGGDADIGGITFESLTFEFAPTPSPVTGAAIHVASATAAQPNNGGQNVRIVRCVFQDCPVAAFFEHSLQASMIQSTVDFVQNTGTAVVLGGSKTEYDTPRAIETYIAGCVFEAGGKNPITGCTGIQVIAAEHLRVENVRLDGLSSGIEIVPSQGYNVVKCHFSNVSCYVGLESPTGPIGTALTIESSNVDGSISDITQLTFTACEFEPGDSETTSDQTSGPGIFISEASGSAIDSIRFVSCYSCRFPGPGMLISGGSDIEIIGGRYAGNNLGSGGGGTPSLQPYGIYAAGTTGLRIIGACCAGKYQWITLTTNAMPSPTQVGGVFIDAGCENILIADCDLRNNGSFGLYINGAAENVVVDSCDLTGSGNGAVINAATTAVTNIFIRNCNVTGYASYTAAVSVSGSGSDVSTIEVTDCAGYNDQGVSLITTPPSSGVTFSPATLAYFGPIEFYVVAAPGSTVTTITVSGHATPLKSGSFLLQPGESGEITYTMGTGPGLSMVVVGK